MPAPSTATPEGSSPLHMSSTVSPSSRYNSTSPPSPPPQKQNNTASGQTPATPRQQLQRLSRIPASWEVIFLYQHLNNFQRWLRRSVHRYQIFSSVVPSGMLAEPYSGLQPY